MMMQRLNDDEVKNIWSFIQRFTDENAAEKIDVLKSEVTSMRDKVDVLAWLGRNHEFLSLNMVTAVILAYKETLTPVNNLQQRQAYISAKHGSTAAFTILKLLKTEKENLLDDESKQHKLAILLSILEPCIINDENAQKAIDYDLVETLLDLLAL